MIDLNTNPPDINPCPSLINFESLSSIDDDGVVDDDEQQ
jgi:hypothetical protein